MCVWQYIHVCVWGYVYILRFLNSFIHQKGMCVYYIFKNHPSVGTWVISISWLLQIVLQWTSVQFSYSVVSNSLWPHELQHARPPCPSPTPGVHSDSRPSSQWCHPAISSSVTPSLPAPNPSQHQSLFQWVNSSHKVAKVLEFQL